MAIGTSVCCPLISNKTPVLGPVAAQRRAERRAELKVARRARRLWAIASCSVLAGVFGLTVGILDVLH